MAAVALPVAGCAGGGGAACAASAAIDAPPATMAAAAGAGAAADCLAAALFSRVLIVCETRAACTATPFGSKGTPISRHKVLRATIGSCSTAVAEQFGE